jgi:uncharacterized protein YjbI with pentapeptide repeats
MAKFTREEIEEEIKISRKLEGADLRWASLYDANWDDNLHSANLNGAWYNKDTRFPEGFDLEAGHGE